MMPSLTYIIFGVFVGIIAGWSISSFLRKRRFAAHKAVRIQKKKERQKKILNHFRVEVKNNTIRLKKEMKRLALSKKLGNIELHFKNFNKRLYKISDKEVLQALKDFYNNLTILVSANDTLLSFIEKNIVPSEDINDESAALFYNSSASNVIQKIEKIVDTGPLLVHVLEEKIGEI
ncbi:hypothetical protein IID62_00755 [candidate division KSB1 bacterium]|nr:hypothetical protein [candidate division KSB1 bacterium]